MGSLKEEGININEQEIRKPLQELADYCNAAYIYHTTISFLTLGISNSTILADKAKRAKSMLNNIDKEIKNILGTPETDGLLANESMYFASTLVVDKEKDEVINKKEVDANHYTVLEHEDTIRATQDYIDWILQQ